MRKSGIYTKNIEKSSRNGRVTYECFTLSFLFFSDAAASL